MMDVEGGVEVVGVPDRVADVVISSVGAKAADEVADTVSKVVSTSYTRSLPSELLPSGQPPAAQASTEQQPSKPVAAHW